MGSDHKPSRHAKAGTDRGCGEAQPQHVQKRPGHDSKRRRSFEAAAAEASRDYSSEDETENNAKLTCKPSPIQGMGLFALGLIPTEARVIEYLGEKIGSEEMLARCAAGNFFIFALRNGQYTDGSVESNLARFINHSCEPNCEIRWEKNRIWIVALRDIAAGEEITFNYTYDLEDYRRHPCHCGSPRCVGYIVAEQFFDHVRGQNELRNANA